MEIYGFLHQISGHFGLLSNRPDDCRCAGHVCKPLDAREYAFYTSLNGRLDGFTPRFCGRVRIRLETTATDALNMRTESRLSCRGAHAALSTNVDVETASTHDDAASHSSDGNTPLRMTFRLRNRRVEVEQATNTWASECQSKVVQRLVDGCDQWFIVLEDVVSSFRRPCVMDLKMGTRQHGDNATEEKRLQQHQKCRQSTSEACGVRLAGMQLYDRASSTFMRTDKYEGRRLNKDQFAAAWRLFVLSAGRTRTEHLIEQLEELAATLRAWPSSRFFSSSLLVAFDGHPSSSTAGGAANDNESPDIVVKLIDFAHSTFGGFLNDRPTYEGADEGALLGLDSLLRLARETLESCDDDTNMQPTPVLMTAAAVVDAS